MATRRDWRKATQWRQRIEEQKQSGLSIARFCERERLALPTFQYWQRVLRTEAARAAATGASKSMTTRISGEFLPVTVVPDETTATLEVAFPNGCRMFVRGAGPQALREVVELLAGRGREQRPC